ncbi:MAG TPA: SoxR reducing system RseC family protein [Deltaproteobacteria bacterium]|jgi:positive regulator of sigma E activity|nr:SoxR reducing system RseC family protein [Deltaproteobacteria bacterium]HQI02417.1 SoxR reducing system RseC family protein [Deltaproteobacteria bacterium]
MINTVCGTVQDIFDSDIRVIVDRKNACQGCQSSGICHGFTKTRMDLKLPKPPGSIRRGDTVVIAMEGASLIKACTYAFLIPLCAIISALLVAQSLSAGVPVQAVCALVAFLLSLIIVRHMGRRIGTPHVVEVIHEE